MAMEPMEARKMLARVMKSYSNSVAQADPEDLAEMLEMQRVLDEAITNAVKGLRAGGRSWTEIGAGIGVSRQAAQQRWSKKVG